MVWPNASNPLARIIGISQRAQIGRSSPSVVLARVILLGGGDMILNEEQISQLSFRYERLLHEMASFDRDPTTIRDALRQFDSEAAAILKQICARQEDEQSRDGSDPVKGGAGRACG